MDEVQVGREAVKAASSARVAGTGGRERGRSTEKRCQQVRSHYEWVVEFADLCSFLAGPRTLDDAGRLVELAETLLAETLSVMDEPFAR